MAEQDPQNPVYQPYMTSAESLVSSLPAITRREAPSPAQAFPNVADISSGYTPQNPPPANVEAAFANLGTITTPYGGQTKYEGVHPGIDIANKEGTPIPSFTPGTVTEVHTGEGWTPNTPSFGNYVVVQDDQGNFNRYSHLDNAFVKVGDPIAQGQELGVMGGTGSTYGSDPNSPGYHLDYRIFDAAKKYYDPNQYLSRYYK